MGTVPSLAESKDVQGTLKEEKVILIRARVASGAVRFSIDLACLNEDIAFHFNPRFDESKPVVICNSYIKNKWGKEERNFNMPFHQGESFKMTITVRSVCYEVSVNGKPFLTYDHRLPYHTVKKLNFRGDVSCEEVNYSLAKDPPPYCPPPQVNTAATKLIGSQPVACEIQIVGEGEIALDHFQIWPSKCSPEEEENGPS